MAQAFIALGANLGEARKALQEVVARINEEEPRQLIRVAQTILTE